MTSIAETVGVHNVKAETISPTTDGKSLTTVGMTKAQTASIYDAAFKCLEDYSMDKRGDVGSWVRYAALGCLEALTKACVRAGEPQVPALPEGGDWMAVPKMEERKRFLEDDVAGKVTKCMQTGAPIRGAGGEGFEQLLKETLRICD